MQTPENAKNDRKSSSGYLVLSEGAIISQNEAIAQNLGSDQPLSFEQLNASIVNGDLSSIISELAARPAGTSMPTQKVYMCCQQGETVHAKITLLATEPQTVIGIEFPIWKSENRETVERFRRVYENVAEGIYTSSLDGKQLSANPALVKLNGYDSESELLAAVEDIGEEWYVDPNRRAEFARLMERDGQVQDFISEVHRHKTRERIWISENARLVRDPITGEPQHYEGVIREITESMLWRMEKERLAKIAAEAPGVLFQAETSPENDWRFTFLSAGIKRLTGLEQDYTVENDLAFMRRVHPEDRASLAKLISESGRTISPWLKEVRMRKADGADIWICASATPEKGPSNTVVWHGFVSDVTEQRKAQGRIRELAYKDTLTRLANRQALTEFCEKHLGELNSRAESRSEGSKNSGALFFIDMDNFKALNDQHGHRKGDEMLCEVANRLSKLIPENAMVSRFGGDEFVVFLYDVAWSEVETAAENLANEIVCVLARPYVLGDMVHLSTPSIGYELFHEGNASLDELMRCADSAMYSVKEAGRNGFAKFTDELRAEMDRKSILERKVRAAVMRQEFEVYFQPILSSKTGDFNGASARLGWPGQMPKTNTTSDIWSTAIALGITQELQLLSIRKTLECVTKWQQYEHMSHGTIAVSVNATCLSDNSFFSAFMVLLSEYEWPAEKVVFELGSTGKVTNEPDLINNMNRLRAKGVTFVLGGFGYGNISLEQLVRLPIDKIRIGASFTRKMQDDPASAAIVESIILMAERVGLETVAAGVETTAVAVRLVELGCEKLRGPLFAPTLTEDELAEWCYERYNEAAIA